MSYIGKTPTIGNFQVCDAISVVNGQAAYTMQVNSVNVVPESANHMLVSLNGILQKPGGSFTVSGSTITFASNLATGDVIDFITLLGNVLDLGTPSDATVTNAKTNFVSTSSAAGLQIKGDGTTAGALQLNCEQNSHGIKLQSPPHSANQSYSLKFPSGNVTAGKFLKVDSVSGSGTTGIGTMTFADAGSTATAEFSAYISSDQTINDATNTALVFQTELFDPDSVYDTSNGRFTAPSDGIYFLSANYWTYDAQSNIQAQNISLYVNGSKKYTQEFISNSLRFTKFDSQINAVISLSATDYVQVYAYADTNDSGSFAVESASGIYQNIFSGFRLPT